MQEGALSLMQMAKTSSRLAMLAESGGMLHLRQNWLKEGWTVCHGATAGEVFDHGNVCLYGEGYGAKIQSGGDYMNDGRSVDFILFDVNIAGIWLEGHNVDDIAEKLSDYMEDQIKKTDALSEPDKVIEYLKLKIGLNKNEDIFLIWVTCKNKIINCESHSTGSVSSALIYPRRIIRSALDNNASGLILAHNHPSGSILPSEPDNLMTEKIKKCMEIIDVKLLDHIIVGSTDYFSYQEENKL